MNDDSFPPLKPTDSPGLPKSVSDGIEALLWQQEENWHRKQPVAVELIVQAAQQTLSPDQYLSLICNERYLRENAGESPTLAEYQQRFPDLANVLKIQWEMDRFLGTLDTHPSLGRRNEETPTTESVRVNINPGFQSDSGSIDGRYSIESIIGSGGMGVVYQAFDDRLQRVAAIKLLTESKWLGEGAVARFRREAEVIARIDHPNIVRVFDTGESERGPYISMEYCAGGSLADWLRQGPLQPKQAAEVVLQIAQGVASAHQVFVIHRDLKPANILLATIPQSNITPLLKISDFGLAKRIDVDQHQTRSGEIVGTPAYLAPEQLSTEGLDSSPGIDIYALGVILYECISGRPPIRGATWLETLRLLYTQEAVHLIRLQPDVPIDLATIAHKCLQRNPAHRYSSAQEVVDELQRFLAGRPIAARPASALDRSLKWAKRNPQSAVWISLAICSATIGLLFWANFTRELDQARREVINENKVAQSQRELAESHALQARKNLAIAMEAVDRFCDNVASDPQLSNFDLQPLRQRLLKDAADFQTSLIHSRQGSVEASLDLARAHARLARVQLLMGSGQEAAKQLTSSIAIYRSIESADEIAVEVELAAEFSRYGSLMQSAGIAEEAIGYLTDGWELANQCLSKLPDDEAARRCAASAGRSLAEYLIGHQQSIPFAERSARAQEILLSVEAILQGLIEEFPDDGTLKHQLALSEIQLARIFLNGLNMRRFREAQPFVDRSISLLESIVQHDTDGRIRHDLARSIGHRARILRMLGKREEEAVELARAVEQSRSCMNQFPTNISYRTGFGSLVKEYVLSLSSQKKWNEMVVLSREAIDAFLVASAIDPNNLLWKISLAECYCTLASSQRESGNASAAVEIASQAINLLSSQVASESDAVIAALSEAFASRSDSHFRLGNFAMAAQDIDEAIRFRSTDRFILPHLKIVRARAYAAIGQIESATTEIAIWKENRTTPGNNNTAFIAAEALAIASAQIRTQDLPDAEERNIRFESTVSQAIELLELAVRLGANELSRIDENRSFDVLNDQPRFQALRESLQ